MAKRPTLLKLALSQTKSKSRKAQEADKRFNEFYNETLENKDEIKNVTFSDNIDEISVPKNYEKKDFSSKKEPTFEEENEVNLLENQSDAETEKNLALAKSNRNQDFSLRGKHSEQEEQSQSF